MGILPGSGPLGSGPTGPGSGFSVMPRISTNQLPSIIVELKTLGCKKFHRLHASVNLLWQVVTFYLVSQKNVGF